MTVLAIVDDLFFQSKIQAAAPPGVEVLTAKTAAEARAVCEAPTVVIVDLGLSADDPMEVTRRLRLQHPAVPIIGYGSHVQTDLLAEAQAAGCTTVLPRSAFVQQLPNLLKSAQDAP